MPKGQKRFSLKVELSNDAMDGPGLAWALERVAKLMRDEFDLSYVSRVEGQVRDINGNTVGTWKVY